MLKDLGPTKLRDLYFEIWWWCCLFFLLILFFAYTMAPIITSAFKSWVEVTFSAVSCYFIWYLAPDEVDPYASLAVSFHTFPPRMFYFVIEQIRYSRLICWLNENLSLLSGLMFHCIGWGNQFLWCHIVTVCQREAVGTLALWDNLVPSIWCSRLTSWLTYFGGHQCVGQLCVVCFAFCF